MNKDTVCDKCPHSPCSYATSCKYLKKYNENPEKWREEYNKS